MTRCVLQTGCHAASQRRRILSVASPAQLEAVLSHIRRGELDPAFRVLERVVRDDRGAALVIARNLLTPPVRGAVVMGVGDVFSKTGLLLEAERKLFATARERAHDGDTPHLVQVLQQVIGRNERAQGASDAIPSLATFAFRR